MFNVKNLTTKKFLNYDETKEFCKEYGFKTVPYITTTTLESTVDAMIEKSKGKSILNDQIQREGIVCRCYDGEYISFKVLNPIFLLEYED